MSSRVRCPRCRGGRTSPFAHEHGFEIVDAIAGQLKRTAVPARAVMPCNLCNGRGSLSEAMVAYINGERIR